MVLTNDKIPRVWMLSPHANTTFLQDVDWKLPVHNRAGAVAIAI
ncbi:hypothetical protein [Planctopirus limnophila]|nr:hypothetical protein [Planctopirus limnophila]